MILLTPRLDGGHGTSWTGSIMDWGFQLMGLPKNGWLMEAPKKWMDDWGYPPHFRKSPFDKAYTLTSLTITQYRTLYNALLFSMHCMTANGWNGGHCSTTSTPWYFLTPELATLCFSSILQRPWTAVSMEHSKFSTKIRKHTTTRN